MSRRTGKAPIDPEEHQRLRDEQQRLWDEAEARRIEERRLQIEQQPTPPEVLQYASPPPIVSPLRAPPWTPFGFGGNPEVTQDDLWRDLNVEISYEEMQDILNEDRERAERERAEGAEGDEGTGGGGAGGEWDIPVPEIMIKMARGRKTSSTGQLVDVRGN